MGDSSWDQGLVSLGPESFRPKAREKKPETGASWGISHPWVIQQGPSSPCREHLRNYIHWFKIHFFLYARHCSHQRRRLKGAEWQGPQRWPLGDENQTRASSWNAPQGSVGSCPIEGTSSTHFRATAGWAWDTDGITGKAEGMVGTPFGMKHGVIKGNHSKPESPEYQAKNFWPSMVGLETFRVLSRRMSQSYFRIINRAKVYRIK